jgi:bifunctional enzyme CysN/CysC
VLGDNVARRSAATPWYDGPSLLEHLGGIPSRSLESAGEFRFPVQLVVRAGQDFRGLAGTVASGSIGVGDEVIEPASGRRARVRRIVTMGQDLAQAREGQAVVIELDIDLDISRGAVWLSDEPMVAERGYLLRTATDLIPISGMDVRAHLDLATLTERPASHCAANDIALARIDLGRAATIDVFAEHPITGSFILVDPISGASVAGGVVSAVHARQSTAKAGVFRLTRDLVAHGLGADLPAADKNADEELRRRANEVAILLRAAGVSVELEDSWAKAGSDAALVGLWLMTILSFSLVGAVLLGLL